MSWVPAFLLLGLVVAAVALAGTAGWTWLSARRAADLDRGLALLVSALTGLAAGCLALVVAGTRSYGAGRGTFDGRSVVYLCQQWWQEAGWPASQTVPGCHQEAVDAVWPALGWSAVVAVVVAAVVLGAVAVGTRASRRRGLRSTSVTFVEGP